MDVNAVKVWRVVCPKCDEIHYLDEEEFFNNESEWSCFCGFGFKVVRDEEEGEGD